MSKRTERMSRSAAERINRKDIVIRQNNAEDVYKRQRMRSWNSFSEKL